MILLRGITWKNPRGYDPLVEASKAYQDRFPNVKIHWDQFPWYEFEQRILDDFQNETGIYDLIMFDHPWTGTLSENEWLLPWNHYVSNDYLEKLADRVVAPSVESYNYKSRQWALPLDAASHGSLYRKTADVVTLPGYWEEIEQWAKEMQKKGYRTPLVLSLQGVLGSCLFLSMMAAYGVPAFTCEKSENIEESAAKYILGLLKKLQVYCPEGSSEWGPWDIYDKFCEQKTLLYSPSIFGYVNYLGSNNAGKNLFVAQVPSFRHNKQPKAIVGGVGLGLTYSCKHIEHAVGYGKYLMSDEVQKEIFPPNHGQPSVKTVWEDSDINSRVNNFYKDLRPNMDNGYVRPRYNGFHGVELTIGLTLQKWWDGESDLDTTIKKLNRIKPEV